MTCAVVLGERRACKEIGPQAHFEPREPGRPTRSRIRILRDLHGRLRGEARDQGRVRQHLSGGLTMLWRLPAMGEWCSFEGDDTANVPTCTLSFIASLMSSSLYFCVTNSSSFNVPASYIDNSIGIASRGLADSNGRQAG